MRIIPQVHACQSPNPCVSVNQLSPQVIFQLGTCADPFNTRNIGDAPDADSTAAQINPAGNAKVRHNMRL